MGKTKKEKLDVYIEQNRSGKLKKIKIYKDRDEEDTTLGFWVSPRPKEDQEREFTKVGEYIFKEDQTLPQCPPGQKWDPETQSCIEDPDNPPVDKPPVIEGPHDVNARTGTPTTVALNITDEVGQVVSIKWQQTLPVVKDFPDFDNKQTAIMNFEEEGDFLVVVTAVDDKQQAAEHGINIKVRTQQIPPVSEFKPLVAFTADTDDESNAEKSIKKVGKSPSAIFAGDGPYGSSADGFISLWSSNVSITRTMGSSKGNHEDAQEDSTASVEKAMDEFFGWDKMPGGRSMHVTKVNDKIGIISMDSQDPNLEDPNGEQFKFVKGSLEILKADGMTFLIIVIHKPFYGTSYKHGDLKDARAVYQPLFDEFGVDLVIQGHNHQTWESLPIKSGAKVTHGITDNFVYDFSKEHGQIYWGNGAGGRGLYTIGSNVPSYIAKYDDNDHATGVIELDENNPKRMRIRNISHADKVLNSTIIDKSGGVTPEPEPKPPVIETDDAVVAGNVNQDVSISANVRDPNNNLDLASIAWSQIEGDTVDFAGTTGAVSNLTFKTANAGVYRFRLSASDTTELITMQDFEVTIREEPQTGNLLWSSNEHGKWNDGNKRTITKKQGGQVADDKSIFVAASGDPELIIDGDGVAHLKAGSGGVDDLSLKGLCSHQGNITPLNENATDNDGKPLPGSKRGGGEGFSISHDSWDSKRERFHKEHVKLGGKSLPKKIQDNKWHVAKFSWQHEGTDKIHLEGFIDYKDGNGFVRVMDLVDDNPDPWFLDKGGIKNNYIWIRLNNPDPDGKHGRIYIMAMNWDAELIVPFMFEPSKNSIALRDVELRAI